MYTYAYPRIAIAIEIAIAIDLLFPARKEISRQGAKGAKNAKGFHGDEKVPVTEHRT